MPTAAQTIRSMRRKGPDDEPGLKIEFRLNGPEARQFFNLLTWNTTEQEEREGSNASSVYRKIFKAGMLWLAQDPANWTRIKTPAVAPRPGSHSAPEATVIKHPAAENLTPGTLSELDGDLGLKGRRARKRSPRES